MSNPFAVGDEVRITKIVPGENPRVNVGDTGMVIDHDVSHHDMVYLSLHHHRINWHYPVWIWQIEPVDKFVPSDTFEILPC